MSKQNCKSKLQTISYRKVGKIFPESEQDAPELNLETKFKNFIVIS